MSPSVCCAKVCPIVDVVLKHSTRIVVTDRQLNKAFCWTVLIKFYNELIGSFTRKHLAQRIGECFVVVRGIPP